VFRTRDPLAKAARARQDFIGGIRQAERPGIAVVGVEVPPDGVLGLNHAAERAPDR
jgi:hypothetical protein